MVSASVGFQCPECVNAGRLSTPRITTVAGGRVDDRPTVTIAIVAFTLLAFGYEFVAGLDDVTKAWGMWPWAIALDGQFYRLATSVFLHGSVMHIFFNMFVLWTIGPQVERILGHARFLVLYLAAGLGGAVASYAFSDPRTISVGASGAIFGLMGALVVVGRRRGKARGVEARRNGGNGQQSQRQGGGGMGDPFKQVLVLIGINIAIGFLPGGNIDWRAHLGGLVTGIAVAAVMLYAPRPSRLLWQSLGVLSVLGLLVLITMWRTTALHALVDSGIPGLNS